MITKEIFKGISLVLGLATLFLIAFIIFLIYASQNFINFLLDIPLSYLWSIGLLFALIYFIHKRQKWKA
jgi:hypothetical protein